MDRAISGINLAKGYYNKNRDSMVLLPESSCSVSWSHVAAESRKVLSSRINSPNFNIKPSSSSSDTVSDKVAGEEINGSDEFKTRSTVQIDKKKVISRTESKSLFEFKIVPLYGVTSVIGRRPEMEDFVSTVPRFLRSSPFDPQATAHFFGVYDGHGGSQVANYCRERMHMVLAEEVAKEKPMLCDGDTWQEKWKRALFSSFIELTRRSSPSRRRRSGRRRLWPSFSRLISLSLTAATREPCFAAARRLYRYLLTTK